MEIINLRGALTQFKKAMDNKNVRIGFIGGSITEAMTDMNWPEMIRGYILSKYPDVRLRIENAAIGGTSSLSGVMRADKELVDSECDIVFVEYAVNDIDADTETRNRTREGLIRKLLKENRDVVLVYTFCQPMYSVMKEEKIPTTIAEFELIARHYNISSVWAGKHAYEAVKKGEITWEAWLPSAQGSVHPGFLGSRYYAENVIILLENELHLQNTEKILCGDNLPKCLNKNNFEHTLEIPFQSISFIGPWSISRETSLPWYRYVIQTGGDGAGLKFDFEGRAIAVMLSFGKNSALIKYRIDGGQWQEYIGLRYTWVPAKNWCTPHLLFDNLKNSVHTLELSLAHGNRDECFGTDCKIFGFTVFQ